MKPDEIRKIKLKKSGWVDTHPSYTPNISTDVDCLEMIAAMSQEIAAQLSELNINLRALNIQRVPE